MTDSTSDLHEDTIFWAEESTQNTEATDMQNASVTDYEPIDVHVEDEFAGENSLQEGGALAKEKETPTGEEAGVAFADLDLPKKIFDTVTRTGFVTPTPIQAKVILTLLKLSDVVGVAQTGTGKTVTFALLILAIVDVQEHGVQALILAPTRELAMQSAQAIDDFASVTRGLNVIPIYGGSPYSPQIPVLKRGVQVVIGTPGHIVDLIKRGALDLSQIRMLVLDEADEMLRMGSAEDVETITTSTPEDRLTTLFSTTIPPAIERIANTRLKNPVRIAVSEESSTVDTIYQTYAVVPFKHKLRALTRVLVTRARHITERQEDVDAAIIFVRTRVDVEEASLGMSARGFRAAGISGNVMQTGRERMVGRLRTDTLGVLVATDVAAHGLNVERISFVVNFDVPRELEAYVHRIGRTNRTEREGRSLTFFTPRERGRLRRIEKLAGTRMEEVQIPSPVVVSELRATRLLKGLNARIEKGRPGLYKGLLEKASGEGDNSILDLAATLTANVAGGNGPKPHVMKDLRPKRPKDEGELDGSSEFLGTNFEGRDKDRPSETGQDSSQRRAPKSLGSTVRYRVEVGKRDYVKPGSTVGAIAGEGGVEGRDIEHIEIFPSLSLVEVFGELSEDQLFRIGRGCAQGRPLRIRVDEGPGEGRAERACSFSKARRFDCSEHERAKREYPRRYEKYEGFTGTGRSRDHDGFRRLENRKRHADQGAERFDSRRGIRGEHTPSRSHDEERRERFDRGTSQHRFGKGDREKHGGREFDQHGC